MKPLTGIVKIAHYFWSLFGPPCIPFQVRKLHPMSYALDWSPNPSTAYFLVLLLTSVCLQLLKVPSLMQRVYQQQIYAVQEMRLWMFSTQLSDTYVLCYVPPLRGGCFYNFSIQHVFIKRPLYARVCDRCWECREEWEIPKTYPLRPYTLINVWTMKIRSYNSECWDRGTIWCLWIK